MNGIKLCCKRGCPEVSIEEDMFIVKDDYGNSIKIKKTQSKDFSHLINLTMGA